MFSLPLPVERSIDVAKPITDVFDVVADFNSWRSWSPWLCQEPECPVAIQGEPGQVGHSQHWDGQRIGSGEMSISGISPPHRIDYTLNFLKPWKSQNNVAFEFSSANGETDVTRGTKITWYMWGTMPVFMFFMRKMMAAFVGSDYERGLAMLKEYLETGKVLSKIDIAGEITGEGFYYIGKRRACSLKEVGPAMEKDFSQLESSAENGDLPPPDLAFSFYHNYDMANQKCEYTSGFGYKSQINPGNIEDMVSGHVESHQALRIDHYGPYRHLGNAWSTAQSLLRSARKKPSKTVPMYEIYGNFPGEVDEKDILTRIHIPLR
jgi:effector-binding domain-containing protein/uncharacterized protein YndB with AHSA1/START domain